MAKRAAKPKKPAEPRRLRPVGATFSLWLANVSDSGSLDYVYAMSTEPKMDNDGSVRLPDNGYYVNLCIKGQTALLGRTLPRDTRAVRLELEVKSVKVAKKPDPRPIEYVDLEQPGR